MYRNQTSTIALQEEPIWYGQSQEPIQVNPAHELPASSPSSQAMTLQQHSIFGQASLEVFRDQCRAGLSARIMSNTAALAALENQCLMQAPNGEREYRLIMETYALRSSKSIWESDW